MRITLGMVAKQYSRGLNNALSSLNTASLKATSFRRFDTVAEDPFRAAKAYRLRRELQENVNYLETAEDVEGRFLTAQSAMLSLNSLVQEVSSGDCLQAITGTLAPDDRQTVAGKLRALQNSVISILNTRFADQYLFAGGDSAGAPFSVDKNGKLLYRGVDVDTGAVAAGTTAGFNNAKLFFGAAAGDTLNGYQIQIADAGPGGPDAVTVSGSTIVYSADLSAGKTNADLLSALKNATGLVTGGGDPIDLSDLTMTGDSRLPLEAGMQSESAYDSIGLDGLKALASEGAYVDLGMGMRFDASRTANAQTVFNVSIPGISFAGFGSKDGVSGNLYNLMSQISDCLESPNFSMETIQPYLDKFAEQGQALLSAITRSGTSSNFLSSLKTRLESNQLNVTEKISNVEFMDSATAIMDYKMQAYAYQAALQMGTKIMQRSFLDYMA